MDKKGFTITSLVLIFTAVVVLTAGGFYFYKKSKGPEAIACPADAKLCPDGSAVGRTGPNCEFAECPTTAEDEWVEYERADSGFVFNLPKNFFLDENEVETVVSTISPSDPKYSSAAALFSQIYFFIDNRPFEEVVEELNSIGKELEDVVTNDTAGVKTKEFNEFIGSDIIFYFFDLDLTNETVRISYIDDSEHKDTFEKIISTLRFAIE